MLGDLLEKKLKGLKNKKILVVMDDELAFLGDLVEFDSNTMVLKKVYQAPADQIRWKEMPEEEKEIEEKIEKKEMIGYIEWTYINLEEVYICMDHVLRIWHWKGFKDEGTETKKGFSPVYKKDYRRREERMSTMGDVQDTLGF